VHFSLRFASSGTWHQTNRRDHHVERPKKNRKGGIKQVSKRAVGYFPGSSANTFAHQLRFSDVLMMIIRRAVLASSRKFVARKREKLKITMLMLMRSEICQVGLGLQQVKRSS
jgi:hypothetical protein